MNAVRNLRRIHEDSRADDPAHDQHYGIEQAELATEGLCLGRAFANGVRFIGHWPNDSVSR